MRINIYNEELTDRVELMVKEGVIGADGNPTTFYGIRFYLASPQVLHTTEHDDDTSAITFWFGADTGQAAQVATLLDRGLAAIDLALVRMTAMQAAQGSAHNASVLVVEQ